MINIVKLLNGNVAIYDNTSGDFLFSMSPAIIEMQCDVNGSLKVVQNNENFEFFDPNLVANTQVLPAAAIAFTGTCADLADILATDFFFELNTIDAIDVNYDNSVSGLVSTNVQDAIDELAGMSGGSGILHGTASGTDTYTVSLSGVASYADGDAYLIRFTNGNTTGSTLNINSLGAKTLYRNNDGELIGGDIWAGAEMLCVYNSTLSGFQCIGTSPNSLFSYVTNADSVTLTKGMAVYAFGGTGDRMTVKRANNSTDATSAQTVGLVLSTSIAANQKGIIIMQGLLDGLSILPTSTYTDGDPIYLGATAGAITKIKPYAPNHLVYLGVVTTANNGSAGRMYVRVQNGYELDELHNVQAQSPTYKDTLWYDNTVSPAQWKTNSIAGILGYTPENVANKATTMTGNTTSNTIYLSAKAIYDWVISLGYITSAALTGYATQAWVTAQGYITNVITALGYTPANAARLINTTTPLSGGGNLTADRTLSISQANTTTDGYLSSTDWNTFNSKGNGTVTSVSALTLGTTGTDLNSTVANSTTTPTITLNVPTASATNRGVLSTTDWSAFNSKESALTFSAPLSRLVNTISIPVATSSANGYLSSTDWSTFNSKQNALGYTPVPQTRTLTINGSTQDLSADRTFTIANPEGWTVIVKSANQDVTNNTTLQDDTELQFSVVAGGHYMIELNATISLNNTLGNYKNAFNVSAGTMKGQGIILCNNSSGAGVATGMSAISVATTTTNNIGGLAADIDNLISIQIIFSFFASANATFKYQFANNAAAGGRTSRTWKGSILKYKRID